MPIHARRHLADVLTAPYSAPFALLRRADGPGVELLTGDVADVARLDEVPLRPRDETAPGQLDGYRPDVLALIPYQQITERGFRCHADGSPLRCLIVDDHTVLDADELNRALPGDDVDVTGHGFDIDDETYAAIVDTVIRDEIGRGEGANFVIRRDYRAQLDGGVVPAAVRLFRRLLAGEPNAYWIFAVHTGDLTMVGATPERHVSIHAGRVTMNPISGTYQTAGGVTPDDLLAFLADTKETEELFMVVDEELKMMSHVCDRGGRVTGPFLTEMGHVVHTEYLLDGRTSMDVRDVLRHTMFAPTVTGSPVENAARVITRYEPGGRGYYSGVAALIGHDATGHRTVDAPILIRTAYLDPAGRVRVPVGATLVRHSDPASEVAETHAKAAGVLTALGLRPSLPKDSPTEAAPPLAAHADVRAALTARNANLAPFWLHEQTGDTDALLTGRTAVIVDAEDTWTHMLAHMMRHLGMAVHVRRWDSLHRPSRPGAAGRNTTELDGCDLVVAGPGPGDPRRVEPRISMLDAAIAARLDRQAPLLAVCLSHQILATRLGFDVVALESPYQGSQRHVDVFGRATRAGFYNTFAVRRADPTSSLPDGLDLAADGAGDIHALRGPGFASVQFHLESVLSIDGLDLLAELITHTFATGHTPRDRPAGGPLTQVRG